MIKRLETKNIIKEKIKEIELLNLKVKI